MIIITAVGADRPGMAHAVAAKLADYGCNIEDTTMTRLCGEFAMILIVSPPPDIAPADLAIHLSPLEKSHGLFINCRAVAEVQEQIGGQDDYTAPRYMLSVYGPEKSGLVARITGVLAAHGVNITDVQTRVASHGTVYIMIFEVELPANLEAETLQQSLHNTAHEIGVEVSLRPLEEDTL
ncbi:MAG: ACT domain-containing protein [Abitibacteriaceae bacterium]|nr:ACT domain-containing protein [Abditibacteriaceae bacterium]